MTINNRQAILRFVFSGTKIHIGEPLGRIIPMLSYYRGSAGCDVPLTAMNPDTQLKHIEP